MSLMILYCRRVCCGSPVGEKRNQSIHKRLLKASYIYISNYRILILFMLSMLVKTKDTG